MQRINIVLLVVVYSICSIWGECVEFQSPTNNTNTKGCDGKITHKIHSSGECPSGVHGRRAHKGIDIANKLGWPIRAAAERTIIEVGVLFFQKNSLFIA